jgi:hypothetical protein
VTSAANGQRQPRLAAQQDEPDHLLGSAWAGDNGRSAVDHAVPDPTPHVIPRVAWQADVLLADQAGNADSKLFDTQRKPPRPDETRRRTLGHHGLQRDPKPTVRSRVVPCRPVLCTPCAHGSCGDSADAISPSGGDEHMSGIESNEDSATICAHFAHIDLRSEPAASRLRPHTTSSHDVPGVGFEPTPPCGEGGLSPPCLPIPPPGRRRDRTAVNGPLVRTERRQGTCRSRSRS